MPDLFCLSLKGEEKGKKERANAYSWCLYYLQQKPTKKQG